MRKPTLGSHEYKTRQKKGKFYESWLGLWGEVSSSSGQDHGGSDSSEYI